MNTASPASEETALFLEFRKTDASELFVLCHCARFYQKVVCNERVPLLDDGRLIIECKLQSGATIGPEALVFEILLTVDDFVRAWGHMLSTDRMVIHAFCIDTKQYVELVFDGAGSLVSATGPNLLH